MSPLQSVIVVYVIKDAVNLNKQNNMDIAYHNATRKKIYLPITVTA